MKTLKVFSLRSTLAIAVAAFCFGTTIAVADEIKAKFGTSLPDSHPQTLGARKFAELVDKKSNGRIKITVFSGAQLGSDQQMQAALRGGDTGHFPDQPRFAGLHQQSQLTSPAEAAARVLAWLARDDFGSEPVADVRG